MFYFVFNIEEPNYFLCNEIIFYEIQLQGNTVNFSYPKSCDQELYHIGFTNFQNVFDDTFNYQSRPLSILSVNVIYEILDLFQIESTLNALISTFILQNLIALIAVTVLDHILLMKNKQTKKSYIFISLIVVLSPLFKWGIFDPSHQLWTMLVIIFFPFLIKTKTEITFKNSILIGLLFLLHRSFLIGFIWYLFFSDHQDIFSNIKKKLFNFIYSLIPYISYNLFIFLVLNQRPYDANTTYWGQFVWLYDFIRGKVRYQSEWHCVTIPENFECYFLDNFNTLLYLSLPIALVLINHILKNSRIIIKKYSFEYYIISISVFVYLFWSFIGWYPPIRFSYYSIGNLVVILFILSFSNINNSMIKNITLTSYLLFTLYLNHWNDPNTITVNLGITFSIIALLPLLALSIYSNKLKKNKI